MGSPPPQLPEEVRCRVIPLAFGPLGVGGGGGGGEGGLDLRSVALSIHTSKPVTITPRRGPIRLVAEALIAQVSDVVGSWQWFAPTVCSVVARPCQGTVRWQLVTAMSASTRNWQQQQVTHLSPPSPSSLFPLPSSLVCRPLMVWSLHCAPRLPSRVRLPAGEACYHGKIVAQMTPSQFVLSHDQNGGVVYVGVNGSASMIGQTALHLELDASQSHNLHSSRAGGVLATSDVIMPGFCQVRTARPCSWLPT